MAPTRPDTLDEASPARLHVVSKHPDGPVRTLTFEAGTRGGTGPRPRSASRAGVEAMVPFILGLSPVALIVGATIGAHEARWAAWMGVWPIFSGNAHVATVRALHDAGAGIAILTGLAVNTRVAAYGFAVAARWQRQPRWFRLLAPGLLVDPTFAADEQHAAHHPDPTEQRRFFLAAGLTLGFAFWALVTIGMLVGGRLGGGLGLDITVPLCLVVSLGARVRARPAAVAATVGALVIVVSGGWPSGTGMLVAIAAGAACGLLAEGGAAAMTTLLVVRAVGAGSYLMRSGPILWHGRAQPPPWVDRAALLAATSALAAVVTSAVLHHERAGHPEARMAAIVAVAVALALATRKVSMLRVIVAGLAVYELARLALAAV